MFFLIKPRGISGSFLIKSRGTALILVFKQWFFDGVYEFQFAVDPLVSFKGALVDITAIVGGDGIALGMYLWIAEVLPLRNLLKVALRVPYIAGIRLYHLPSSVVP